eukprot:94207_1
MSLSFLFISVFITCCLGYRPKVNGRYLTHRDLGPGRHQPHIRKIFGSKLYFEDSYYAENESNPIIYVTDYGADPTGATDSTSALTAAITEATKRGSKNPNVSLANGIHDCGGATIHLGGGDYLISAPLIIPQYFGNLRMVHGTLRASPSFTPKNSYLLIVGDNSKSKCNNPQGSCNENVAIENMMFDASHIVDGCVQVIATMGFVVGPQMFFLGFNAAGVTITGGHETMISDAWFGEFLYSSNEYKTAKATGIQIFGNDHYVTNTIVFSSKIGVHVTHPANILTGVHTWNLNEPDGGIGFLIESTQTRLLACYYDGNDVIVTAPIETVSIEDGFFLGSSQVILRANGKSSVIDGLSIMGNQYIGGSGGIIALDESNGKFTSVKQMMVRDNLVQGSHTYVQPRITDMITLSNTKEYVFDFKGTLLFDPNTIEYQFIDYTVQYNDNSFTPHALRKPSGTKVTVQFNAAVDATVYVTVDQSTSVCY